MGSIMTPWLKSYDTQIYTCTCTHVFMLSLHVSTVYDSWIDLTRWKHCVKIQPYEKYVSVTWRSAVVYPVLDYLRQYIYIYIYISDLCLFSNPQIGVQFSNLSFFKFSNHFLKSTSKGVPDVCTNPNPNRKDADFRIPLSRTVIWDNDFSGFLLESGR